MLFKEKLAEKDVDKKLLSLLPSGYQIIGHVLLIKLNRVRKLKDKKKVAKAILDLFPYVKTVCEIKRISGELREPCVKKLAGNGTITTHKEHGIVYKLDASKIMFSKGNLSERKRLARQIKKNEVIVDMFAGIGYFSLGIARSCKTCLVYAIEKNPAAFKYLLENIRLNKINNIFPVLGDCRKIAERLEADRVIMGYLPGTEKFLKYAFIMLRKDKKCIIHYHNTYRKDELWKKPIKEIRDACRNFDPKIEFKVLKKKKVKSFAPNIEHVVLDVEVRRF